MSGTGLDREKLVRVLGMLGSDHPGEILAAAGQAERLRRGAGLTWADILTPALPSPTRRREVETVDDAINFALDSEEALTQWELGFLLSLRRQRTPISPKQIAILDEILTKVRRAEARAA